MRRKSRITVILTLSLVWLILPQAIGLAASTNQISQFGITWTFNKEYEYGQFANGDYWVVNPDGGSVTIIGIDPASFVGDGVRTQDNDNWVVEDGRTVNGAMINPDPTIGLQQGYDSSSSPTKYNESLNVARKNNSAISISNKLELPANTSLISSISLDHNHYRFGIDQGYILKTAAVLTILDSVPPEGSFRPPYAGTDKTIKFNESQLNYNLLRTLDKKDFADSSDLKMSHWTDDRDSSAERKVDRPWIEHLPGVFGEVISPMENMYDYPGYRTGRLQDIPLFLNLNWSGSPGFINNNEYKRDLLVGTVQIGIDLYGIYQAGAKQHWVPDGGHAVGRKWPILFAGVMLEGIGAHPDATAMANIGFNAHNDPHFGEDGQSFYVNQRNLDFQNVIYGSGDSERGWADPGSTPYIYDEPGTGTGGVCGTLGLSHTEMRSYLSSCGPDPRDLFDIPYTQEDVDNKLPGWGIKYRKRVYEKDYPFDEGYHNAFTSNRAWQTAYRRGQTSANYPGLVLSMHIMNLKSRWNHDSFFDYMDRYIAIEKQIKAKIIEAYQQKVKENPSLRLIEGYSGGYIWDPVNYVTVPVEYNMPDTPETDVHGNIVKEKFHYSRICSSDFVGKMWDTYRADYGPVWTPESNSDSDELEDEVFTGKTSLRCYNNVFNPTKEEEALIWVELPKQARVKIDLYNTRGNKIRELADEERDAETCRYYWNGKDDNGNVVGSGLYFVHVQAGNYKMTKKIVVVK